MSLAFLSIAGTLADLAYRKGVATDLFSLAGGGSDFIGALAKKSSGEIRVLCEDEERAAKCRAVFPFRASPGPDELLGFYASHGQGLLSDKSRAMLEAGEYDKIRRGVTRRDYTGVGLFPKAADPFYFLSDYVASLKALMPKGLADGQVLLTASAKGSEHLLADLIAIAQADDGVYLSGAPFHTFLATENSKREINILGGISLATILLIGFVLFRSPRFILPTLATLASGFLAGAAAVFLLFPKPHILTFLFGSTLIGLGVDYCYHSLSAGMQARRPLVRNMMAALATTILAFAPLSFSSVAVLNQMAVFTVVGLVAIWAIAATGTTHVPACRVKLPALKSRLLQTAILIGYLAMLCVNVRGLKPLSFTNDPSHFYAPPPILARGEAKVAGIVGSSGAFAVVSAPTLEEALQKEESLGVTGVSRILPSLARQRRNAELVAAFAGTPLSAAKVESPVTLEALPDSLRVLADAMIMEFGGTVYLLSPATEETKSQTACISPKAELEKMFSRFSAETAFLLLMSFAAMAVAQLLIFRRRFFDYFTPVFVAVIMTAGTLGWIDGNLTFFHAPCFFVMTGVGIDYVIFHNARAKRRSPEGVAPIVFFSFLTSLVGFGALAFTSFPPTRAMGVTMSVGLFYCYLLSLIAPATTRKDKRKRKPSDWSKQKEKGASRLGILIIWHIYRLFGKTAAKLVFLVPLAFIAPFCRGVGLRRMLAFAWSRIDIVDAVTLRKNIPLFSFSGDTDWREGGAFLVSSHLGSIEVLAALCDPSRPPVHAFQQMAHDPVFTSFLTERLNGFTLHAVEDIGVETAAEMQDAIRSGALVLMAGDRMPASAQANGDGAKRRGERREFLGRVCEWPKGVFRFAKLMESPVYAIVAVKTGWNAYEIKAKRLGTDILDDYVAFLETEIRAHPEQWFQFHDMSAGA